MAEILSDFYIAIIKPNAAYILGAAGAVIAAKILANDIKDIGQTFLQELREFLAARPTVRAMNFAFIVVLAVLWLIFSAYYSFSEGEEVYKLMERMFYFFFIFIFALACFAIVKAER